MKYIRTKDGKIFDTSNFEIKREIYENGELKMYEFWTTHFVNRATIQLFLNEVLKIADTIEELCDEFVFMSYGKPLIINSLDIPRKYVDNYVNQTFGAIWTEWGLKYVAKMNEKGELELL